MSTRGWVKSRLGSRALLRFGCVLRPGRVAALCFHDLRDDDDVSNWLRVPVTTFERMLLDLKEVARFVSPSDMGDFEKLSEKALNVLLTFDDGYVNNLRLALPVLERHHVPALIFVSSQPMLDQRLFRADLIVTPVQVLRLDRLDLTQFGLEDYRFPAADAAQRWERIAAVLDDVKRVGNDDDPRVAAILDHLRCEYEDVLSEHGPRFRPLTASEVKELDASPWIHIGSHSHRHEILTRLEDAALVENLVSSRRILGEVTGKAPEDLAYPNGNWNARVAAAATAAGYRRAWTARRGLVRTSTPRTSLPRIMVGGFDSPPVVRFQIVRLLFGGP